MSDETDFVASDNSNPSFLNSSHVAYNFLAFFSPFSQTIFENRTTHCITPLAYEVWSNTLDNFTSISFWRLTTASGLVHTRVAKFSIECFSLSGQTKSLANFAHESFSSLTKRNSVLTLSNSVILREKKSALSHLWTWNMFFFPRWGGVFIPYFLHISFIFLHWSSA